MVDVPEERYSDSDDDVFYSESSAKLRIRFGCCTAGSDQFVNMMIFCELLLDILVELCLKKDITNRPRIRLSHAPCEVECSLCAEVAASTPG